jgi:hypothetical protein
MKYEIDVPAEIERQLETRASQMGKDVVHLIQVAVVRFVSQGMGTDNGDADSASSWSDEQETRRRELIDKDIAGTITPAEQEDLSHLDRLANEHFDLVAPPPMEGARQLHQELLTKRDDQ